MNQPISFFTIHDALDKISPEYSRMYRFILLSYAEPHKYVTDEFDRTPIHYAVMVNAIDVLEHYLASHRYNIDWMDCHGQTALCHALTQNPLSNAPYILLAHGANPNICAKNQPTPLMLAILKEDLGIVDALLKAGANPCQRLEESGLFLKSGETALSLATRLNTLHDSRPYTESQLSIIARLLEDPTMTPNVIFHALQQTTAPLLKKYILVCCAEARSK